MRSHVLLVFGVYQAQKVCLSPTPTTDYKYPGIAQCVMWSQSLHVGLSREAASLLLITCYFYNPYFKIIVCLCFILPFSIILHKAYFCCLLFFGLAYSQFFRGVLLAPLFQKYLPSTIVVMEGRFSFTHTVCHKSTL